MKRIRLIKHDEELRYEVLSFYYSIEGDIVEVPKHCKGLVVTVSRECSNCKPQLLKFEI
jgi:hypothetical protein